ncbi:hypothetical protein ACX0G9_25240, partial [Flavitalea flava]
MREQKPESSPGAIMDRIHHEYQDLIMSSTYYSLEDLFNSPRIHLKDFCNKFTPHPRSSELRFLAEEFGRKYGIWMDNAKHHISCALYLYPDADFDRMLTMMKNLTIGFFLND